jgi:hypothetical protein
LLILSPRWLLHPSRREGGNTGPGPTASPREELPGSFGGRAARLEPLLGGHLLRGRGVERPRLRMTTGERRFPRRGIRQSSDECQPLKSGGHDVTSLLNFPTILGPSPPRSSFRLAVASARGRRRSPVSHGLSGALRPSRPPQGPPLRVTSGGGLGQEFVNTGGQHHG